MNRKSLLTAFVFITLVVSNLAAPFTPPRVVKAAGTARIDAMVLVNSSSEGFNDFQKYIQPYLDNFGVPHTVVDIAVSTVPANIADYAEIIIGHRRLDPNGNYLDGSEQASITAAVSAGTGLVNFDNYLSTDGSAPAYAFVNSIFGFGYTTQAALSGVSFAPQTHYITERHAPGETINTGDMTLAGITLPGDGSVSALAMTGSQPFLAVKNYGSGRAVQWGTYDWMSVAVKGPLFGLDDLVWRSIVWAAHKPFALQSLPPFVTMRMDDVSGPFWWIHDANSFGFIPWAGIFTDDIDSAEAADLSGLVSAGKATAAVHAFSTSDFFYFNHDAGANFDDSTMQANYGAATTWFNANHIPISKYLVPHYYEIGSNTFAGLQAWGTEFIGTMMDPGFLESGTPATPWMAAGPYRKYQSGTAYDRTQNPYYADYMTIPGHAELDNKFFNCISEIRDVTGYEWLANDRTSVTQSAEDGTAWLKRALDSLSLATLFSHEYTFQGIMPRADWNASLQAITRNIASYNPRYVSMDYACQYLRAIHNSNLTGGTYDAGARQIMANFSGTTDITTKIYVFTDQEGVILQSPLDVPVLDGSDPVVSYTLPGPLHHITVTPDPANVIAGVTQQFMATGYDASNAAIPGIPFTWSVANGGGSIDINGLFTAGATSGAFSNTVRASFGSLSGFASVNISLTVLDHFSIDAISSPRYKDAPFNITIRARDATGNPVVTYTGTANLSVSGNSIQPAATGSFVSGAWTGTVTLSSQGTGFSITAADGSSSGASNLFDVNSLRTCPCSIWDSNQVPTGVTLSDNRALEVGVKFRTDVNGYITGLRFYKDALNDGIHIGHLWTSSGVMLAEGTFVAESASGWQEVIFSTPIPLTANTTYIASYHSDSYYTYSLGDLSSGVDNAPVHALADGFDGPNGLYNYGPSGTFPSQGYQGRNYLVDVVFDTVVAREYSLWNSSVTPDNPAATDSQPIEVGVKFQSANSGKILGLRYYKGAGVTGVHTGHLWTSTGTLLASVDFTNETAQGWQEARLSQPVDITENTTYIASYFSPVGFFAYTAAGLLSTISSPPLRTLVNGESGPNGVYNYGSSAFPTQGNGANYWADVIFARAFVPDSTAPVVNSVYPLNQSSGVSVTSNLTATFSEPMNPVSINASTFELRDTGGQLVPAVVSYIASSLTATLDPQNTLAYSNTYTAKIKGGTGGVSDVAGNPVAQDFTWTFTTTSAPPPPLDEGPGGPILIISDSAYASNPFGRYYTEILRAEGFNSFLATDISNITASALTSYKVVLLAEMSLSPAQISMLDTWVQGGGKLIAFRPAKALAAQYGLTDAGTIISEGYLAVNTSTSIGQGIVSNTIQFHGAADTYTLSGASSLATLYTDATTTTASPAIASFYRGSGQVVIFAFDLARSIIYMRQGNPAWAGQEGDGIDGIRAIDMFVGRAGQPNWIDTNKMSIPQADEEMHVLSHAIEQMLASAQPLPRLWYFPNQTKGTLIMTGDSEGCSGTCVNALMADVNAHGGYYTAYLLSNAPSPAEVNAWRDNGNGLAPHYDDTSEASNPTISGMTAVYDSMTQSFINAYGFAPRTVRNHWILWTGWADQAAIEAAHGIQMDTNYYHNGSWLGNDPGYFTGSGLPMRFTGVTGNIIDLYQANTQLPDETWGNNIFSAFKTLIDASIDQGYYGFLTANFHPPNYSTYQAFADNMMDYAASRGIPIWSAEMLLDFSLARNQAQVKNLQWDGNLLSFTFSAPRPDSRLTLMLPVRAGGHDLQTIIAGGNQITFTKQTMKGYEYALFTAIDGAYQATYAADTIPPVVSSHSPASNATGIALNANVTVTFSEEMDPATIIGSTFRLRTDGASSDVPAAVSYDSTSLTATLNPDADLAFNKLYYVTVSGTVSDASGNPLGVDQTWSFTTQGLTDTTVADFSAGSGTCAIDANLGDGALRLGAVLDESFSGTSLPIGWSRIPASGGALTVSDGLLSINGVMARDETLFQPGQTLEFAATFQAEPYQHIGFGANATTFENGPWILFSTGQSGTQLYARIVTSPIGPYNTGDDAISLGSQYLGSQHVYRIAWNAGSIELSIDGILKVTRPSNISDPMRVAASDFVINGNSLQVDWIRMASYTSPCNFTSRLFDTGEAANWDLLDWNANLPTGASLSLQYRLGNTADLGGAQWIPVTGNSPKTLAGNSQYIQYQVVLGTTNPYQTPVLQDVTFNYHAGADTTAPTISGLSAAPGGNGYEVISWNTDEPSDSLVQYGTNASSLFSSASSPALVVAHSITLSNLPTGTKYYFRVTSKDAANNGTAFPLAGEPPASFKTPAVIHTLTDTNLADFSAGSSSCTIDPGIGDGAVRLPLMIDENFYGTTLPADWTQPPWPGGGQATVSEGSLNVNGGIAGTTAAFSVGSTLEFIATFSNDPYQHVGFVNNLNFDSPWAIFSTNASSSFLYARVNGASMTDIQLPGSYLNAPHVYRIEWNATGFKFYIDGALVETIYTAITTPMIFAASDYVNNSNGISVDSVSLTPYISPCTLTSRVLDAAGTAVFSSIGWIGTTPAGTDLSLSVRTGTTITPDGTWTAFTPVTNGASLPDGWRYLQYQAQLSATDGSQTPVLADITIQYQIDLPPVAIDDIYTTTTDVLLTVASPGVLANDIDTDSDLLTAVKVTDPAHGTLSLNSNGSFTYTPTNGFSGSDSFTYKANDGTLGSNIATVSLQITAGGTPPLPASFFGLLHFNKDAPGVGTTIEATIPGVSGSFNTSVALDGSDLFYMLDVPGDISGTPAKEGGVEGDTVSFSIGGRILASASWHSGTHSQVDLNSFALDLLPGWNLVSFPLHPASTNPADVLSSIISRVDTVFAWNPDAVYPDSQWLMFAPGQGFGNTLSTLDEKMGFWVHVTPGATVTLSVSGSIPTSTSIPLSANGGGWNLVGFPAAGPKTVAAAAPSSTSMIFAYDAGDLADPWKMYDKNAPSWVNDLSSLAPGWGFWVQATTTGTWSVDYP